MGKENHGNSWSGKDEGKLETMLYDGMSKTGTVMFFL